MPNGDLLPAPNTSAKARKANRKAQLVPPPEAMLRELVGQGAISEEVARMAAAVPMADDVTAEADSGGHTDNRPAITSMRMCSLRNRVFPAPSRNTAENRYHCSSSQAFELILNRYRMTALPELMTTINSTSQ